MDAMAVQALSSQDECGVLTIDLGALARNYQRLRAMAAPAETTAVVKADAYGLGADIVSKTLYQQGCRTFCVAHFVEAVALRPILPADAAIYVLNGLQPGNEEKARLLRITPVLNSLEQISNWSRTASEAGQPLPAAIQVDTGMCRLGLSDEELRTLIARPSLAANIAISHILSHLASADDADAAQNESQLARMSEVVSLFPGVKSSFANSGGIFLGAAFHNDLARPGIALYGGVPTTSEHEPLSAVVKLEVQVIQTRTVPAGAKVGYGGDFTACTEMRLATISAGYADGLPRSLGNRGAAYFGGTRLPIVGRVSMDSITIDISALPAGTLRLGSYVELIGQHQTLDQIARDAGTISYEILTSLGQRYRRIHKSAPAAPLS